ncbi:hypothetical protein AAF712_005379 [Marasmius tenuissimus]|uniref:F-box domain-containing protein n=1 Tax=Marasmius tenuissimus TaxID=585030 RepID=A0ABR3A2Z6_9AGAR
MCTLESLPVELISDIFSELDLDTLIVVAQVSRRLNAVVSSPSLNPWRNPIRRLLSSQTYHTALKNLSVRRIVPRQNWIEILALTSPSFILFDATLPKLKEEEWKECFYRRFLPSWRRWSSQEATWKASFMQVLYRVWHRGRTSCTVDETWTKYIVLHRKRHANLLEASTRNFNPLVIFNQMKLENDLIDMETRIRLVVQLADARIIAFGVLNRTLRRTLTMNPNAQIFLHPPGAETYRTQPAEQYAVADHGVYPLLSNAGNDPQSLDVDLAQMTHPLPALSHANYPWYTPGGSDKRWLDLEEDGFQWIGGMMILTQLGAPRSHPPSEGSPPLQDLDLVGPGRQQYASFTWSDLEAVAPWMKERITQRIDGPGLGN